MPKPYGLFVLALATLFAGCSPADAEHATPPNKARQGESTIPEQGSTELMSSGPPVSGVGYLQVPVRHIRKVGSPPVLKLCLEQSETAGLIANRYDCTRWVPLSDYLPAFFPGSNVELTRWEFQCLASGGHITTCDRVLILYYQVP